MSDRVVLLTIPGLRAADLAAMPVLRAKLSQGDEAILAPSFPCLSFPLTANMATGVTCREHGVVADSFYRHDRRGVDVRPTWSNRCQAPAIWQVLREHHADATSAVCFVPGCHDCGADVEIRPEQGESIQHIVDSTAHVAAQASPDFLWCNFPQVADAAERHGPYNAITKDLMRHLDAALARLFSGLDSSLGSPLWLVASPYTISPVRSVFYPNRLLREAGLLAVREDADGEHADLWASRAWAISDRQVSHVYVADGDTATVAKVVQLFSHQRGIAEVLAGEERSKYDLNHSRSGDAVVISSCDSWQAFDWWLVDDRAPGYARHSGDSWNLGSDPRRAGPSHDSKDSNVVAYEIRGSHGAPATNEAQRGAIFSAERGVLAGGVLLDTDVCDLVLRQFGI
jgi:predicted AlkP superfamily pyrophosphatase or phosphodiesterase